MFVANGAGQWCMGTFDIWFFFCELDHLRLSRGLEQQIGSERIPAFQTTNIVYAFLTILNFVQFQKEGEGGMPEFIANLTETDIIWGGFKVVGVDDRGNTISRRPKYVFVKHAPAGTPTMKRARAGKQTVVPDP